MIKEKSRILEKEFYITPDIEIVEIDMEQNILANPSGKTIKTLDTKDIDWF